MNTIALRAHTALLSLVALLSAASVARAQHFGYHPAPHVGSVHYGGFHSGGVHPGGFRYTGAGANAYHYMPPTTVRYEHYHAAPGVGAQAYFPPGGYARGAYAPGSYGPAYNRGSWRYPYAEGYLARCQPGWFPIIFNSAQYYAYSALPLGYETVVVNGITYYLFNGVYYQPYFYQGQTVFMVVPPPVP